jgi:glycosyltransferase involved in cell wall biosynthesis
MNNVILFDQDLQHYRVPIYKRFAKIFKDQFDLSLIVIYDLANNTLSEEEHIFKGINYSFANFITEVSLHKPKIIIQFVWLRYKFLIPFMIWSKLKGIKIILWSHGINLQNKKQTLKNQLYFLRQRLSNALVIYTPEQKKYIKTNKQKIFVANNTLDFNSLPEIIETKEELKIRYRIENKKVILCVGRMDTNNRKIGQLIKLASLIDDASIIIIIGPGVKEKDKDKITNLENIVYLGPIFNQKIICEYYKLADLYVMPGAIGLAINQAFYYGTPVIIEDVDHGPEGFYLKQGINGFTYREGDVYNLEEKIDILIDKDNYKQFCVNAKKTVEKEASFESMTQGFIDAINYLI